MKIEETIHDLYFNCGLEVFIGMANDMGPTFYAEAYKRNNWVDKDSKPIVMFRGDTLKQALKKVLKYVKDEGLRYDHNPEI